MNINITIYHDRRKPLKNGLYPVKIRVHSSLGHKTKFYQPFKNKIALSEEDFKTMMGNNRIKGQLKDLKIRLDAVVFRFLESASRLNIFNFQNFEKELGIDYGKPMDVFSIYEIMIQTMDEKSQIGNRNNYISSCNSFKEFQYQHFGCYDGKEIKLWFTDVTSEWLNKYEYWMIGSLKRSITSISIYVRTLRAVFNYAQEIRIITDDLYPFGKGKYIIPQVQKVKKALTPMELDILIKAKPVNKYEEKSRDLFLLLFYLHGINVCDFINLKNQDYKDEIITYYRIKNQGTKKSIQKPTIVYVHPHAKELLEKYKNNHSKRPEDYLIDYLENTDSERKKYSRKQALTRFINEHLKVLANRIGINPDISTNYARHTFATQIVENGGGIELAKELLNHSSVRVTEGYFSGFPDSVKSKFIKKMFNRSTNES